MRGRVKSIIKSVVLINKSKRYTHRSVLRREFFNGNGDKNVCIVLKMQSVLHSYVNAKTILVQLKKTIKNYLKLEVLFRPKSQFK
jgi:hypothetical protein